MEPPPRVPTVVIELADNARFAREIVSGGVFVPGCALSLDADCALVVRGPFEEIELPARVVFVDRAAGAGLELVGYSPALREHLTNLLGGWCALLADAGGDADLAGDVDAAGDATHAGSSRADRTAYAGPSPASAADDAGLDNTRTDAGSAARNDPSGANAANAASAANAANSANAANNANAASAATAASAPNAPSAPTPNTAKAGTTIDANTTDATAADGHAINAAVTVDDHVINAAAPNVVTDTTATTNVDADAHHADDDANRADEDADDAEPNPERRRLARNYYERLRGLSVAQQIKAAHSPDPQERIVLERLYNKTVWEPLLRNPRLTPPEVARIARMGTVPRILLEVIVGNGAWLQMPEVRRALLSNPRLGTDQIVRVLRLLPKHELKLAAVQTAYPHAVRDAARRLLKD